LNGERKIIFWYEFTQGGRRPLNADCRMQNVE
jgi:hypothetical protein